MKRLLVALCVLCLATLAYSAPPSLPSDASIKELLTVAQAHKMLDSMIGQMEGYMESSMKQAHQGQPSTPEEAAMESKLRTKMVALLKEELAWDKMEDMYVKVYRESFTQEEVTGLINFYKSPAGQAFVTKMPIVMQKSMTEMQQRMGPIMQKIQTMVADSAKELQK